MKRFLILLAITMLAGCSTYKLGTIAYIPHGQFGSVSVGPTLAKAASAP